MKYIFVYLTAFILIALTVDYLVTGYTPASAAFGGWILLLLVEIKDARWKP